MTIVWGHNNFRLKAVEPAELGMLDKSFNGIKFELRQKYGHLFWIPFIPLEKMWVVKKQDGKLYECPREIQAVLRERYPMRTSLWAWTGPLLIIAGLISFAAYNKYENYSWEKRSKENYIKAAAGLTEKIKTLVPGDYVLLSVKQSKNNYYDYDKVPLKVLAVNNDSVTVGRINLQYRNAGTNNTDNLSVSESEKYHSKEDLAGMELRNDVMDKFTISKTTLLQGVCTDNTNESQFPGVAITGFTNAGNCMIKEIVHVDGPVLQMVRLNPDEMDGRYYEFKNMGFDVQADSIVTTKREESWQISKIRKFDHGDTIAIKCNTKDVAILYSSDKAKKVYKTKIDNSGYTLKLEE